MISSSGAQDAAKTQADAANRAADLQRHQQEVTRADLMPYDLVGQSGLGQYQPLYDQTGINLDNAFNATQAHIPGQISQSMLEQMPGYQFQLAEGQKALKNSLSSRGYSGLSGPAIKAAMNYGTGLASTNWQNLWNNQQSLFNDYNQQFSNRANQGSSLFNQLSARSQLGENAAATTGVQGTLGAANAGSNIAGAGTALGAGQNASSSALASGIGGVAYQAGQYINSPAGRAALSGSGAYSSNSYDPTNSGAVFDTSGGGTTGATAGGAGTNFLQSSGFYTPLPQS